MATGSQKATRRQITGSEPPWEGTSPLSWRHGFGGAGLPGSHIGSESRYCAYDSHGRLCGVPEPRTQRSLLPSSCSLSSLLLNIEPVLSPDLSVLPPAFLEGPLLFSISPFPKSPDHGSQ